MSAVFAVARDVLAVVGGLCVISCAALVTWVSCCEYARRVRGGQR